MTQETYEDRVLAVDPMTYGLAYAVFEGDALIAWGFKDSGPGAGKNTKSRTAFIGLVSEYRPTAVVLEHIDHPTSRKRSRVTRLIESLQRLATSGGLRVVLVSPEAVREAFASEAARTREDVAAAVAELHPELAHRLPPSRKIWMSEDKRIHLFDAAAFAIALLRRERRGDVEKNEQSQPSATPAQT